MTRNWLSKWFRRVIGSGVRTPAVRPVRRPRLGLEALDRRDLPSVTWAEVNAAFVTGEEVVRNVHAAALVACGFGADLPLLDRAVSSAVNLVNEVKQAFPIPAETAAGVEAARQALEDAGFDVEYADTTPDADGDLVRVRWDRTVTPPTTLDVGGDIGFDYFQGAVSGNLGGSVTVTTPTVGVGVTFGVDLVNGVPTFYVAEDAPGRLGGVRVEGLRATGSVTGDVTLRRLADVHVEATLDAQLGGTLTLSDGDATAGEKLRLADFANGPAAVTAGGLNGTITLAGTDPRGARMTANVPVLAETEWYGSWSATVTNGTVTVHAPTLTAPDIGALFRELGTGLLSKIGSVPVLGDLGEYLSRDLPVLNVSLADRFGLGWVTSLGGLGGNVVPAGLDLNALQEWLCNLNPPGTPSGKGFRLLPEYQDGGAFNTTNGSLTWQEGADAVGRLIRGEPVTLIDFQYSGGQDWGDEQSVLLGAGMIGPFAVSLSAEYEWYVGWDYSVGFGIDTTGFYFDPNTGIGVHGGVRGGLSGEVSLAGIFGLEVTAGAGVRLSAGVGLNDPDPTDGKVYLDEIYRNGESVAQSVLDSMRFRVQADATGFVRGEITTPWPLPDITLFDKEFAFGQIWGSGSDNRVQVQPDGRATKRVRDLAPVAPLVLPVVTEPDGTRTLVIDGTPGVDRVALRGSRADGVEVTWYGRGVGTFRGIDAVRFTGGAGHDELEVRNPEAFDVRVIADGGAGNDVLTGGRANDSLTGGDDNDDLHGGGGNDTLAGGGGDDLLDGGIDNDVLAGGGGQDIIRGDSGHDVLDGGVGGDLLDGGSGDDALDGADGNDTLLGGIGNDRLVAGADHDYLSGGDGNDDLSGGTGNDVLGGGTGNDILYGGAGNDRLDGGDNDDLMFGNADDDTLNGGAGLDTLYGDDAQNQESGKDVFEIDFLSNSGVAVDAMYGGNLTDYIAVVGTDTQVTNALGAMNDFAEGKEMPDAATRWQVGAGGVTAATAATGGHDDIVLTRLPDGTFEAGWRRLGSTAAYQPVRFVIPGDIDGVIVDGLGGNDRIEVAADVPFRMQVNGGAGNDTLYGGAGQDTLRGGSGNDVIFGRGGDDALYGRDAAAAYPDPLPGDETDDDTLDGGAGSDAVYGETGNDVLTGGDGRDVLYGGSGNDRLEAGAGIIGDVMYGGDGNDTLIGGPGRDDLTGGADADVLVGGDLGDYLQGDGGNDTLVGETGRDLLYGGEDHDTLHAYMDPATRAALGLAPLPELTEADRAAYRITLLARQDVLQARETPLLATPEPARTVAQQAELTAIQNELVVVRDTLTDLAQYQSVAVDRLNGDGGNDTLYGSPFNDFLNGNAGDDLIYHSGGRDDVQGGAGSDTYAVRGTEGRDRIDLSYNATTGDAAVRADKWVSGQWVRNDQLDGVVANRLEIENVRIETLGDDDTISLSGLEQKVPFGRIIVDAGAGNDLINAGGYQGQTVQFGGDGNDTLTGGSADDEITGGIGNDSVTAGAGHDRVWGGDGADTLIGGTGNDTLVGGRGADAVFGEADNDSLEGDGAADAGHGLWSIEAGENDTLVGGLGVDVLVGHGGNDLLVGDTGDYTTGEADFLFGGRGADTLQGDGGNDYLAGEDGNGVTGENDTLYGGRGADTLLGDGGNDYLVGDAGDPNVGEADVIAGGYGADTLIGNGGNDVLIEATDPSLPVLSPADSSPNQMYGHGGDDRIYGGPGNDSLYGGSGGDYLNDTWGGNNYAIGDDGNDTIVVGTGAYFTRPGWNSAAEYNEVYGGAGGDYIQAEYSSGRAVIGGGSGDDYILATQGDDWIDCGDGNDTAYGMRGNDWLYGRGGNDLLAGDAPDGSVNTGGNDYVIGEAGADVLYGGWGNDYLDGGYDRDPDQYFGGWGSDRFVFYYYWAYQGPFRYQATYDSNDYNWGWMIGAGSDSVAENRWL